MIALYLQQRTAVEHTLQRKLLFRELKIFEARGNELYEHITIICGDKVDDVEALDLALNH